MLRTVLAASVIVSRERRAILRRAETLARPLGPGGGAPRLRSTLAAVSRSVNLVEADNKTLRSGRLPDRSEVLSGIDER